VVALVVAVDRKRGVRELRVGLETHRAGLDGAAARAVSARVVQRRLQPRVPGRRVRHASARPVAAPALEAELVHLGHVGVEQAEVLLDVVGPTALVVLVEEREDVHVHVRVGAVRGARAAGEHAVDDVVVVRLGVGDGGRVASVPGLQTFAVVMAMLPNENLAS
jgi:hypothetical protein